jgi:alkylhydroperoxidase family enzyme
MSDFKIHDAASAPESAQPLLQNSLNAFGMIPNLHGVMAESPVLLEGYQILHGLAQKTSFDKDELTVVWQSINVEHACHYCVPAHSGIAKSMGVSEGVNEALRDETALPSEKLNILRTTTLEILRSRGHLSAETKQAFFAAGYSNQQILDIILVLSQKVMSNYVNHLADTPVDDAFKPFAWEPKA